jgi:23S rRNA (adenine2503-C2)-methyltransferase
MLTPAMSKDLSQPLSFDASAPADDKSSSEEGQISFDRALFGLDAEALSALMVNAGEAGWRGRQLAEAIYRQRIAKLSEITTLPKLLRQRLAAKGWEVGRPQIVQVFQSVDGTERYLIQGQGEKNPEVETGAPGESSNVAGVVETVWMPEGDDGDGSDQDNPETLGATSLRRPSGARVGDHEPQPASISAKRPRPEGQTQRATLCVSSQVGCQVGCQFCLTAKLGFQRNLSAGEIAGQVLAVFARHGVEVGRDRVSLVFMGMGEPFLNYDNFMAAVRLLVREVGLSPQRMTVSTAGIVPGIERFAQEPADLRPRLAISLNAPNDAIRDQLMPINRKWPIAAVVDAVRKLKLRPHERITFEYVLLGGVTDRPDDAREVARLLRRTGLPVKVNLITWNPGPGLDYSLPQPEAVDAFRHTLVDAEIPAYVRNSRGRDIYAACGQLKRTVEQ